MQGAEDELERVVAPACDELGVDLVDVELRPGTILVTVDRPSGLDLDTVATVSSALSRLLDMRDDLTPKGRYELEVTSPGLERRLRRPSHFAGAIGLQLSIKTHPTEDLERRLEGRLEVADDEAIVLRLEDGTDRRIAYAAIDRARTQFDWRAALAQSKERFRGAATKERANS